MKVCGIVAEFNPLHTGHQIVIDYAKKNLRANGVIVVMSGDFTQRGTPAVVDKYTRAACAVRSGADLVIELPAAAATASAELFARTGVSLLAATGVVTDLVFGAERPDPQGFLSAAALLSAEPPAFRQKLQDLQKEGLTYAQALSQAYEAQALSMASGTQVQAEACGVQLPACHLLESPNNLLGLMYVKAILEAGFPMRFHAVRRQGAAHNDGGLGAHGAPSSSAVRKILEEASSPANLTALSPALPSCSRTALEEALSDQALVFPDDFSLLLHERLLTGTDLSRIADVTSDLSDRMRNSEEDYTTFSSFAFRIKSRNMTLARVRRALTHILLDISDNTMAALARADHAPYLHILAFSGRGASLLSAMKERAGVPFFAALSEDAAKGLPEDSEIILKKDLYAHALYNAVLTQKNGRPRKKEVSRRVLKIDQ